MSNLSAQYAACDHAIGLVPQIVCHHSSRAAADLPVRQMGGGLSKRKRVADYSPEFDVPVVYENVAHLQRLLDSYMPPTAVPAVVQAHIMASMRDSMRRSSSREHAELVERLSPPMKEHSAVSANRISQITSEVARRSTMLVCEDAELCRPRSPGDASSATESVLSLCTDVVLSPLRGNISLEKAVAVLGDEATEAAIVSTELTRRSHSSDDSTSGSFNSTHVTTALDGCRSSADTALAVLSREVVVHAGRAALG